MGQAPNTKTPLEPAPGPTSSRKRGRKAYPSAHVIYADELCERLDITADTLYRSRGRMERECAMPVPLSLHRPFRWNRKTMEAWLNRTREFAPPANDETPAIAHSDAEQRAQMAQVYGQGA
jgi:hypothetical protein